MSLVWQRLQRNKVMKNNNDRVFVIAILTEVLLSAIVVLCMVLNYRTIDNANIQS